MIEIGEVRRANQLGYKGNLLYMWCACEDCGKEKWTRLRQGKPIHRYCRACVRLHNYSTSNRLRGSKNNPYVLIRIKADAFFYPMVRKDGCILEHRLIMAKHLNRCLLPWEVVHHRNGEKKDNRLENLELLGGNNKHNKLLNKEIKRLQRRVYELERELALIK